MLISQVVENGTVRLAESWVMLGQVLKVKICQGLQVFLGERVWFLVNFMWGSTDVNRVRLPRELIYCPLKPPVGKINETE
jgi:hypothetical protein